MVVGSTTTGTGTGNGNGDGFMGDWLIMEVMSIEPAAGRQPLSYLSRFSGPEGLFNVDGILLM